MRSGGVFFCTICARSGNHPSAICGCGIKIVGFKAGVDGGYRCVRIDDTTPAEPAEVFIVCGDLKVEPVRA